MQSISAAVAVTCAGPGQPRSSNMSLLGRGRPLCCLARLQSRNANSDGTYGAAVHPSRFFSTWEEQEGGPLSNASGAVASKPLVQVTQSLKGHKIELQVLGTQFSLAHTNRAPVPLAQRHVFSFRLVDTRSLPAAIFKHSPVHPSYERC